jgi:hypothetical protein
VPAAILASEVADKVNALALVPESATVIAGVATVPLLETVTVCAAGAEEYPAVAAAKV